jgi:ribosomal protein RSM22 (predicted rRNA methylase)
LQNDNSKNKRAFGPFVLSVEEIKPFLLNPNLKDSDIARLIPEMSHKFTKARDQITDYVQSEDHVSAYTALYLPTNIPKLHFLLEKLSEDLLADLSERPFIDIGSGPGTFLLGWSLLFQKTPPEIIAVDTSRKMLEQAKKIINGFFPESNLRTETKFHEKKSDSVLFFGHSINEMGTYKAQDLIMSIDPEYVIWIEPGTSELFRELRKLRENILEYYDVIYPCPSAATCPAEWCHQVLRTSHDQSVERISQLVSLDRKILPMAAHIYRRKKSTAITNEPTTIRFINETKFSFEYEVCYLSEGKNKNDIIEIQKKQLSKEEEKHFKNADVGEKISFEIEKIVGKKLRVKLKT